MMTNFIDMPFAPDMAEAIVYGVEMLDGRKVFKRWTARYKPKGRPGDIFDVLHHCFKIVRVFRARLSEVADNYELEGFRSREEFVERWKKIHPKRGFRPDDIVWVHEFEPEYNARIERFRYEESEEI
ncbi:MAG: hypothetical protein QHH14_14755 [Clostridiales bacterium]|jgi:hypothetical protein|nr:hypothetical protein [Clostridiales bacterium]